MEIKKNSWKTWEIFWIVFSSFVILFTSLYWKDNLIGIEYERRVTFLIRAIIC